MVSVLDNYPVNSSLSVLHRLEVFGALIGKVPPQPLLAKVLWRQPGGQGGEGAIVRE
jgi:hypothetical protein